MQTDGNKPRLPMKGKYRAELASTFCAQYSNSLPLYLLRYNKNIEWASHTAHMRSRVKKQICLF